MGTWLKKLQEYEKELLNQLPSPYEIPPIIAIGGFSGSGKDTTAARVQFLLKKRLNLDLPIYSAGAFVRKLAYEKGYPENQLHLFMELATKSEQYQRDVDEYIEKSHLKTALTKGGIFIGRLAPFTIGDWGLTVFLTCDLKIIVKRLQSDPKRAEYGKPIEEIEENVIRRDEADIKRLQTFYHFNFNNSLQKVDLVINSGRLSVETISEIIFLAALERLNIKKNITYVIT